MHCNTITKNWVSESREVSDMIFFILDLRAHFHQTPSSACPFSVRINLECTLADQSISTASVLWVYSPYSGRDHGRQNILPVGSVFPVEQLCLLQSITLAQQYKDVELELFGEGATINYITKNMAVLGTTLLLSTGTGHNVVWPVYNLLSAIQR